MKTTADQTLRRVGIFTEDRELQQPLRELEQNVADALEAHKAAKAEKHTATPVRTTNVAAQFHECVLYDPAAGQTIDLPRATPNDHGKTLTLKNTTTDITAITVRAATGQLIDDAATKSIGGSRQATRFYCDGTGWWVL